MKKIISHICLLFFVQLNFSQVNNQTCACCNEANNLFDFWIGDWTVYDINGKIIGKNSITKIYDNCVLQEKWTSLGKNRGTSYNYYNKKDNTWNQIWIDNSGYNLVLKGNYLNGKMVLKSELKQGSKGKYYNQITWTKNNDGSVTQIWNILDEKNKMLQEAFRGIYKKSVKTVEK